MWLLSSVIIKSSNWKPPRWISIQIDDKIARIIFEFITSTVIKFSGGMKNQRSMWSQVGGRCWIRMSVGLWRFKLVGKKLAWVYQKIWNKSKMWPKQNWKRILKKLKKNWNKSEKWYFVTKIVLTYCEKKLF